MGINTSYKDTDSRCNSKITEDSSLLEYILGLSINAMNYISKSVEQETIPNMVKCVITESPMSLDIIKETVNSQDKRRQLILDGENDAETFIEIQIK